MALVYYYTKISAMNVVCLCHSLLSCISPSVVQRNVHLLQSVAKPAQCNEHLLQSVTKPSQRNVHLLQSVAKPSQRNIHLMQSVTKPAQVTYPIIDKS